MAYTSGRRVESKIKQKSPIAAATATARRLAKRHLPVTTRPIISSKMVAGLDGTVRLGVDILFTERDEETTRQLAAAIAELPGYHSMCWNRVAITYLINL